eukprot:5388743-Prymnesium_polylepis.1
MSLCRHVVCVPLCGRQLRARRRARGRDACRGADAPLGVRASPPPPPGPPPLGDAPHSTGRGTHPTGRLPAADDAHLLDAALRVRRRRLAARVARAAAADAGGEDAPQQVHLLRPHGGVHHLRPARDGAPAP